MSHRFEQKKLQSRVNRLRGQVDAVDRLLREQQDCLTLLQQISAVRGAVDSLMAEVLEHHIREHLVAEQTLSGEQQHEVEVLVKTLKGYLKK